MNLKLTDDLKIIRHCPLCDVNDLSFGGSEQCFFPEDAHDDVKIFDKAFISLSICNNCGFAFTQSLPSSPTFFSHRYDNKFFDPLTELNSNRKKEILDDIFSRLNQLGKKNGTLLDIGSFAGNLMEYARTKGFSPQGVELNPTLAQFTIEKLKVKVYCDEFQKAKLPQCHFDVITIIDVLEHLVDPLQILKNIKFSLKDDGILIIKVPNYPMQRLKQKILNVLRISSIGYFGGFGHINHFSISPLEKALSSLELEIILVETAPSEKWNGINIIFKIKNLIRDSYLYLSRFMFKFFKINIALNLNYYIKKSGHKK